MEKKQTVVNNKGVALQSVLEYYANLVGVSAQNLENYCVCPYCKLFMRKHSTNMEHIATCPTRRYAFFLSIHGEEVINTS